MEPKKTQHDVGSTEHPRTGGQSPTRVDPSKIEQGTKPSELRDAGDKADAPKP